MRGPARARLWLCRRWGRCAKPERRASVTYSLAAEGVGMPVQSLFRSLSLPLAALLSIGVVSSAEAQQKWPSKPIRIFTSTSGGPYDVVMRATGVPLAQALGQPVIMENRTGGSFVPVADGCAKS